MEKNSNNPFCKILPDIQNTKDPRGIPIDRVGVENIDFPILIAKKGGGEVLAYAKVDLFTSLHKNVKGTNMSRFLETLMNFKYTTLTQSSFEYFLHSLKAKMGDVTDVYAKFTFKYFLPKISPVSKKKSVMAYDCSFIGVLRNNRFKFQIQVIVPTTSNCPCSKEISKYGAHGQRSFSTVLIEPLKEKFIWLEDIISLIEQQGSSPIFPLLKRPDEKWVTEHAYENPKFVEDIARDIAVNLQKLGTIRAFKIKVSNEESIHTHNAVCYIARRLRGKYWRKDSSALRR